MQVSVSRVFALESDFWAAHETIWLKFQTYEFLVFDLEAYVWWANPIHEHIWFSGGRLGIGCLSSDLILLIFSVSTLCVSGVRLGSTTVQLMQLSVSRVFALESDFWAAHTTFQTYDSRVFDLEANVWWTSPTHEHMWFSGVRLGIRCLSSD